MPISSLILISTAGCSPRNDDVGTVFSHAITVDAKTGWLIIHLNAEDSNDPRSSIAAKICAEGGCTLFSLTVGGHELVRASEDKSQFLERMDGIPIMFPTPNRVRNQEYVFMGDSLRMTFPGDDKPRRLHGLVRDDTRWKYSEPVEVEDGVVFRSWYVFDESNPRFPAYPFLCTLRMEFKLMKDRIRVSYEVENQDNKPLGYGFGLHPFWNVIGTRDDVRIQADLPWHMDAIEMMPTGKLDPARGTVWDLSEPKILSQLHLDDVYFGATLESTVRVIYDVLGLEIVQRASPDFTHVVVYTPETDFVCVENQTCSTDTHNLYAQGLVRESNLLIVEPGMKNGGQIEYSFVWKENEK